MKTPIIALCEPFFLKVLHLINKPVGGADELKKLQRDLTGDLNGIQAKIERGEATIGSSDWLTIKKVLIYWADEVLTHHTREWEDYTLEWEHLGVKQRAYQFYLEGEKCLANCNAEVAEMFYLAVSLGFVGFIEEAFRFELKRDLPGGTQDPNVARKVWSTEFQRRIRHSSNEPPQGEPLEPNVPPRKSDIPKRIALAAFLITGVLLSIAIIVWYKNKGNPPDVGLESSEVDMAKCEKDGRKISVRPSQRFNQRWGDTQYYLAVTATDGADFSEVVNLSGFALNFSTLSFDRNM